MRGGTGHAFSAMLLGGRLSERSRCEKSRLHASAAVSDLY